MPWWARFVEWLARGSICIALLVVAAAAVAACDRDDSEDQDSRVGAGFLPTATAVPRAPGAIEGFYGWCPPLPRIACLQPGDTFNPYRDLDLQHVVQIEGHGYKTPFSWVLDQEEVSQIVAMLDSDVRVEEPPPSPISNEERAAFITFVLKWAPGFGAFGGEYGRLDFDGDTTRNTVGFGLVGWQTRPEFFELLTRYMSDVSPTPEPSATATPQIVPEGSVFFEHPDDPLEWDGPAPSVVSHVGGHCEHTELTTEFGVPSQVLIGDRAGSRIGFWAISATRRDPAWRWTGYTHDEWEIWQGDDPETIYIVARDDQRIAFEYRSFGCI